MLIWWQIFDKMIILKFMDLLVVVKTSWLMVIFSLKSNLKLQYNNTILIRLGYQYTYSFVTDIHIITMYMIYDKLMCTVLYNICI